MGSAERRVREKEELKSRILESAKKLFVEKGIQNVTIRKIAADIEYSVGTIYLYYTDKTDILHDLHTQGFTQLFLSMSELYSIDEPMDRLVHIGRKYMEFALSNPDMYDLMFTQEAPMEFLDKLEKKEWDEGKAGFSLIRDTVKDCMDVGYFEGHQLESMGYLIWSAVHGMCSLYVKKRISYATDMDPNLLLGGAFNSLAMLAKSK